MANSQRRYRTTLRGMIEKLDAKYENPIKEKYQELKNIYRGKDKEGSKENKLHRLKERYEAAEEYQKRLEKEGLTKSEKDYLHDLAVEFTKYDTKLDRKRKSPVYKKQVQEKRIQHVPTTLENIVMTIPVSQDVSLPKKQDNLENYVQPKKQDNLEKYVQSSTQETPTKAHVVNAKNPKNNTNTTVNQPGFLTKFGKGIKNNKYKLVGLAAALVLGGWLWYNHKMKPIVYSPKVCDVIGTEMVLDKPLIPGSYIAISNGGKNVDKVKLDIPRDGKLPSKSVVFDIKSGKTVEIDTIGYKKGERVASAKTILHGKSTEYKPAPKKKETPKIVTPKQAEPPKAVTPKAVEPEKTEPQKIEEEIPKIVLKKVEPTIPEIKPEIKEEHVSPAPEVFDLGKEGATVYKIQTPGKKAWFLNFSDTLAHSKDGKEGVVEFMYPTDVEKDRKVEKSFLIAADVPKKLLWDYQKPKITIDNRSKVNKFVKDLLDQGYIIKGQNEDGLFLFDKETAEEHNIKVDLNQHRGGLQKRLCDVVTWEEDAPLKHYGSDSDSGGLGDGGGSGSGGSGSGGSGGGSGGGGSM